MLPSKIIFILNFIMIINAKCGRIWAAKDYVDPKRIGIWGWVSTSFLSQAYLHLNRSQSYGGFMSSKVLEAGAGVHSLAMAVSVTITYILQAVIFY